MIAPKHSASAASANSSPTPQPGRILALDYGQKRIGLAISDEARLTAQPLDAFPRTNRRDDITRLRALIREHGVREIVIGLPLHLDGRASDMSTEVRRFAERLHKHVSLPIHFVDERLTSWDAENERLATGSNKDRDSIAAAIILRDFLAKIPQSHAATRTARTGRAAAPAVRKS
jgi:putative holliday junction resolvase